VEPRVVSTEGCYRAHACGANYAHVSGGASGSYAKRIAGQGGQANMCSAGANAGGSFLVGYLPFSFTQ